MSEELEKMNDVDKMKALQLQIKARKIVLNQSLSDNKVLQQGSSINGKYAPYSAKQLKDNLLQAIMFSEMPSEERASKIIEKVSLKGEEERRTELEGLKAILREKAEKAFKASKKSAERNQQSSRKKGKKPKLFGKRIKHKWDDGWYEGKVVKVYGDDEYATDCEFRVEYDDFPDEYEVNLMEDWKNNWVVFCKAKEKSVVDEGKHGGESRPVLVGKHIVHEYSDRCLQGKVLCVVGDDAFDTDCEFEVQYEGKDEKISVRLMEDWKKNKVKIVDMEGEDEQRQGKNRKFNQKKKKGTDKKRKKVLEKECD